MSPRLPDEYIFFLDECIGEGVAQALLKENVRVVRYLEHFEQGIADAEWLPVVGQYGWVLLTRDLRIRRRHDELNALVASGVRAFILTGRNLTGEQMAKAYISALPKMKRYLHLYVPPFVAAVNAKGKLDLRLGGKKRAAMKRE